MGCKKAVVVCALIGFLGVLSAVLGFAAEGTRVKTMLIWELCVVILPSLLPEYHRPWRFRHHQRNTSCTK